MSMAPIQSILSKLYLCFELVGTASVALWVLVWIGLVVWSFRTRGMRVCLAAAMLIALVVVYALMVPHAGEILAIGLWSAIIAAVAVIVAWAKQARELPPAFALLLLAIVALGLGRWNSANIAMIREDRSAELAAARQRQTAARQAEAKELRSRAANIKFAEDDANDSVDAAGYNKDELARIESGAAAQEPEYRKRGKKRRDANQIDANSPLLDAAAGQDNEQGERFRLLPGADYVLANQLDMMNRFMVWLTLVTALLVAAAEYLRRFNNTFGSILPLPISGRAVDAIWPKTHSVLIADCVPARRERIVADPPGADCRNSNWAGEAKHDPSSRPQRNGRATGDPVAEYLDIVVHKGESFILFADDDPWPTQTHLSRLPLLTRLWPMRKIAGPAGTPPCDGRLVFESAWYGRYSFVILAESLGGPAAETFGQIIEMLRMRYRTRAKARRTVHLVWDLPEAPPAGAVDELIFLCREANFKFVAVANDQARWPAEAFEETHRL
jgi:hypothetical protein